MEGGKKMSYIGRANIKQDVMNVFHLDADVKYAECLTITYSCKDKSSCLALPNVFVVS